MTEIHWLSLSIGAVSFAGIIVAIILRIRGPNGKVIDLLKNELLAVLRELAKVTTANGQRLESMSNSVNEKLSVQNQSLIRIHERIDSLKRLP